MSETASSNGLGPKRGDLAQDLVDQVGDPALDEGGKIYRGDFANSMVRDVRYAVSAPAGLRYVVTGTENLRPNPPGPV